MVDASGEYGLLAPGQRDRLRKRPPRASIEGDDTVPQHEDRPAEEADVPQEEERPAAATDVTQEEAEAPATTKVAHDEAKAGDDNGRWSLSQLRKHGRQHGLRHEDAKLAALVKAWVENAWKGDSIRRTFIETELEAKLGSYRKQARSWRTAQVSIWLLIAVLGLLISVFAGFKSGHGFTIIAGALVATLTTLTNATHPSKQADGYLTARLALRDDGWYLLNHTGEYAKLNDEGRYAHFVDQVHKIVQTKRTSTNLDALTP